MGITEKASKVTDPTPHTRWPRRMMVGVIDWEEGEKEFGVREIQDLAHSSASRRAVGRAGGSSCTEGLNNSFKISTSLCGKKEVHLSSAVLY